MSILIRVSPASSDAGIGSARTAIGLLNASITAARAVCGCFADTVVVPFYGRAAVEFTANQPGLTLFHCHIQTHMDYGFKALFRYA